MFASNGVASVATEIFGVGYCAGQSIGWASPTKKPKEYRSNPPDGRLPNGRGSEKNGQAPEEACPLVLFLYPLLELTADSDFTASGDNDLDRVTAAGPGVGADLSAK